MSALDGDNQNVNGAPGAAASERTMPEGHLKSTVQDPSGNLLTENDTVRLEKMKAKTIAFLGDLNDVDPLDTIRATGRSEAEKDSFFWSDEGEEEIEVPEHAPTVLVSEFEMLEMIGKGGMGVVFRARQPNLGREVAVKTMRSELKRKPELQEAFLCEAIVTAILDHPNIVPVHSMATSKEGLSSFSMKLVRGTPWSKLIHDKVEGAEPTPLTRHLEILKAVAHAVDFAHDKGILHRDLKPDNIMVGAFGEVLVMDWGLACGFGDRKNTAANCLSRRSQHANDVDHIAGTPAYLSPEMALGLGQEFGPWTDVYLLGAMLHEVLMKKPPHQGPSVHVILENAVSSIPPLYPDSIPRGLQNICRKAMAPHHDNRYQTTKDFIGALDEYESHHESEELAAVARADAKRGSESKRGKRAYGFYNQAIAGFRQALAVWPENKDAAEELAEVHRSMAEIALERGDLGIAHINIEELEDKERFLELAQMQEEERRVARRARKRQKIILAAAAAIIMLTFLIEYSLVKRERSKIEEEKTQKQLALDDFERMSDIKQLASARQEAALLWPPSPSIVDKLEDWVVRYQPLFDRLDVHRAALAKLREGAEPYDEKQRLADYRAEFAELGRLRTRQSRVSPDEKPVVFRAISDRVAALEKEVSQQKTWDFGTNIDRAFMAESLGRLVKDLAFESGPSGVLQSIQDRIKLANIIEAETVGAHAGAWRTAQSEIREDAKYGFELSPIAGLIPLGKNAESGLQEFLHWLSHGREAPLPVRHADGEFKIGPDTGIILVLLPGGPFQMGSVHPDEAGAMKGNIDADAAPDEWPVHEVNLKPFFMGKYEVTQGQWQRLYDANPSFHVAGTTVKGTSIVASHPVEQVDWNAASEFSRRMGLALPTEAQWEYACRAGTASPFSTGTRLAPHSANIADEGSRNLYTSGWRFEEDYVDDHPVHAPVGSLAPNAFGLFDMHGNVFEWCQDWYGPYAQDNMDEGTGLRHPLNQRARVRRGGSFFDVAVYARSANRYRYSPEYRFDHLGFRVAAQIP